MRQNAAELAIELILKLSTEKLRDLTEESLAGILGIDSEYLSQEFKKDRKMSCADFILREKLHRAFFSLTEEREKPIDRLSEELGFSNCRDFSIEFEKYHAISPERYRALKAQGGHGHGHAADDAVER